MHEHRPEALAIRMLKERPKADHRAAESDAVFDVKHSLGKFAHRSRRV